MYESSQNKKPSWTPNTVQKKGKSPSKLGHFSIQPKPHHTPAPSQENGEYKRPSGNRITENIIRGFQAKEQELAEGSNVQRKSESPWAPTFDPPPPLPQDPASKLKGAFAPVSENQIQRQCAECAREMVEQKREKRKDLDETGIQTKLTVGAPGDAYEQEADQVAAQVMSMPDNSPHVQKYSEANYTNEIWQRAQSIKPVVQRVVDPSVEMGLMVQRAHQMGGNQASGDLESRLNASKGGGSPLSEDVKGFMEPRFGADFSGVRVHTGGEAVQMNQELGAQAFTHGSDVYFGQGKTPGNNELTAHELTHVVQQTGAVQPVVQRVVDPLGRISQMKKRPPRNNGNQASGDLEKTLKASKSRSSVQEHLSFSDLPALDSSPASVRENFKNRYGGVEPDGIAVNSETYFDAVNPAITQTYGHSCYKSLGEISYTELPTEPNEAVVGTNYAINRGDDEITITVGVEGAWSEATTWSCSVTTGMTFSQTVGVEGVFSTGVEFSVSVTAGQSNTSQVTRTSNSSVSVKVPPRSKRRVEMVATLQKMKMAYEGSIQVQGMFGANFPKRVDGHYFWFLSADTVLPKTSGQMKGIIEKTAALHTQTEVHPSEPI